MPDVIKQVVFVTGRVLHQGTGEPIVGEIKITAQEGPVSSKVLSDGTFALSGDLEILFPNLATQSYQLHLNVHADSEQFRAGSIDQPELVTIPSTIPSGPSFDPDPPTTPRALVVVPTILLPADPVNIRGRVVNAQSPDTSIFGARIEVLQNGVVTDSTTTAADGRYRFDEIGVQAPAQIQCSATGFRIQPRILLIDFGKLLNEEYFRLEPL